MRSYVSCGAGNVRDTLFSSAYTCYVNKYNEMT